VSERYHGPNLGLFLAARPGKVFADRSTRA
jgi:hypothetical protein